MRRRAAKAARRLCFQAAFVTHGCGGVTFGVGQSAECERATGFSPTSIKRAAMQDQAAAFRDLASEVREGRDEQRAQTQALLRLIDRMDRLDPGGAAA
jgi:hypothetical protein